MSTSTRLRAVKVLHKVLSVQGEGQSLREALAQLPTELPDSDRGLLVDLCFGVCRHYRLLDHWLEQHMDRPLKPSARTVRLAVLCGLYECWFSPRPAHAVVNAWPEVVRKLQVPWASGLINALLRKASRLTAAEVQQALPVPVASSLPDWLWYTWQQDWPEQADAMAWASLSAPPMTLRINRRFWQPDEARKQLGGHSGVLSPWSLYLDKPRPVQQLPGFTEGRFSVQDEAAQLPAELMELAQAGGRILDACAAPGGKTGQLAERFPDAEIIALDVDQQRLKRVADNLQRLQVVAKLCQGDAATPEQWWDGQPFDAILLDAPCSATGILRRQPDIKWHRRVDDIASLVSLQQQMLGALWPLVKPGGILVYATCSVLKAENARQVEHFLQLHTDATEDTRLMGVTGCDQGPGIQLLPTRDQQDGFYLARFYKRPQAR